MMTTNGGNLSEEWRPVAGYEGVYEVSSLGRVRRLPTVTVNSVGATQYRRGRIMRPAPDTKSGYLSLTLCWDSIHKTARVHNLVLAAFHGPRPAGHEACHGPLGSACNWATNLRWGTHAENMQDLERDGTRLRGEKIGNSKLAERDVLEIRRSDLKQQQLARRFNVSRGLISLIRLRKIWRHI